MTLKLTRFDGWNTLGAVKHPKDTRTVDELKDAIKTWALANKEVKEFLPHLNDMNPKHLGLVADTIELANRKACLPNDINLKSQTSAGKTLLGVLLDMIPVASKNNPNAVEFAQEVINNTDSITSKYFLWQLTGSPFLNKDYAEYFKAATPLVEIFAKSALEHPKIYSYENQMNFMNIIENVVNKDADIEKVGLLKPIYEKIKDKGYIILDKFVTGKTPIEKIKDNLSTLDKVADLFHKNGKLLDAGEYLTKNTNLY